MDTLQFGTVGTCNATKKNLPKAAQRLEKGESEFKCNNNGTLLARWRDTKEVILLSNCHNESSSLIQKKNKDGSGRWVSCPEAIQFYRKIMDGVDLADQIAGLYDLDRKSLKWWKKVFYRCLMFSIVNSWVVYKQLQRHAKKNIPGFFARIGRSIDSQRPGAEPSQERSPSRKEKRTGELDGGCRKTLANRRNNKKKMCRLLTSWEGDMQKTLCRQCNSPYCKTCFSVCHM